jgi:predicted Zn-dependent protease
VLVLLPFSQPITVTRDAGEVSRHYSVGQHSPLLLFFCALFFAHNASADVPLNSRKQELAFSSEELHAVAARAYHLRLEALAGQGKLDNDSATVERLRRIAGRVIAQAILLKPQAADWPWEVHVATTTRIEAFSMAGGKIVLGLPSGKAGELNDPEIAALLAHEVAHAIAEHVREQLSEVRHLSPAYADFSLEDVIGVMNWDLGVALKLQPLSRLHELEADDIGIQLTAKAGFRPHGLAAFYSQLDANANGPGVLDSHGPSDQRVRAIRAFEVYADLVYAGSASAARVRPYAFSDSSARETDPCLPLTQRSKSESACLPPHIDNPSPKTPASL